MIVENDVLFIAPQTELNDILKFMSTILDISVPTLRRVIENSTPLSRATALTLLRNLSQQHLRALQHFLECGCGVEHAELLNLDTTIIDYLLP